MIKEFVDALVNSIFTPVSDYFNSWVEFFTSPLWLWGGIGLGVFILFCIIAIFLPFKWVRATLGGLLVLGGSFLFGGITMYRSTKGTLERLRAERKQLEAQLKAQKKAQRQESGSWFGF